MQPVSDPRRTLAACSLASSLVFLDGSVVNVALPAIRADLGGGLASQQWVVEGFLLALAALLLLGGSLGDLMGRRRVLIVGTLAFGATSLLCAVAPTIELLIAGRILQGIAGALLVPVSLAIITATFTEAERGSAIGSWTARTSMAMIAGPFVGGILVDQLSWRLIFAINVPLVVLTIWLARGIASDPPRKDVQVDVLGGLLASLGLAGVVFALVEQAHLGWVDPLVNGSFIAGVVLLITFIFWESQAPAPMLPLGLFRNRNFAVINVVTLALYAPLMTSTFLLSVFLQQVAGYSAAVAGLALLPTSVVVITTARRFGGLADRRGARRLVAEGTTVCALAFALLSRLSAEANYFTEVFPAVTLLGIGLAMAVSPLTAVVLASVPESHAGTASGVNNAASRVAGLLAIAALGTVATTVFQRHVDAAATRFGADGQAALTRSRERPLVTTVLGNAGPDRGAVGRVLTDASVDGYRTVMVTCAGLAALAAAIAAAGLTDRRP